MRTDRPTGREGLTLRQANFLDGIRIAAVVADAAERQLLQRLEEVSLAFVLQDQRQAPLLPALGDAWQIVDCVNRANELTRAFPGLKKREAPWSQSFARATSAAKSLRNVIQHLETDLPKVEESNERSWGTLEWLYVSSAQPDQIHSFKFVPGWVGGGEHGITYLLDDYPAIGTSRIRLAARGDFLDILDSVSALQLLINGFHAAVAQWHAERPALQSDALFQVLAKAKHKN